MASPLGLLKPEYLLQPRRLFRRIFPAPSSSDGRDGLATRWGVTMASGQRDEVSRAIELFGLYDVVVTEAIWRLVREGDTVIDVGANIGAMTVAAAARLARAGRIVAFEPHPTIFADLAENARRTRERFPGVTIETRREALSDADGVARLSVPEGFDRNRGIARIGSGANGMDVSTRRLDGYAEDLGAIALMKIDIEGHEAAALRGARGLLERRAVRHVVFEEHGTYPTETTTLLEQHGFTILSLERTMWRVRLGDPSQPRRTHWEALSLLATLAPDEAKEAFRAPGWRALSR